MIRTAVALGILLAIVVIPARADQVQLKNGDRITGVIARSDRNSVIMKTEFLGDVEIQWTAVTQIESDQRLFVTDEDGQVLVGQVTTAGATFQVRTEDAGVIPVQVAAVHTIRSQPEQSAYEAEVERLRNPSLLDFWSGYFDAGLSLAQGNAETQTFTTSARAQRRTQRDKINIYSTSIFAENGTTGETLTTANAIRGGTRYDLNLSERLFLFGFIDLEFDEFQSLDLRNVLGGGLGWHVKNTDRTVFDLFAGGSFNQEFFADDVTRRSAEVVVGEELSFKLNDRLTWSQRLALYPNISRGGEYRLQFDTTLVTQLRRWLGWQITISDRFLSNPIPGIKKNDVLISTGVRLSLGKDNLR